MPERAVAFPPTHTHTHLVLEHLLQLVPLGRIQAGAHGVRLLRLRLLVGGGTGRRGTGSGPQPAQPSAATGRSRCCNRHAALAC